MTPSTPNSEIRLYNTLSSQLEVFQPLVPGQVKMYVCGPTVYDYAHLGHARCYLTWDLLYRYLKLHGFDVTYVRNITDVDDKILNKAKAENKQPFEIADTFAKSFLEDMAALNILLPEHQPKATDYITQMLSAIDALIENGAAYTTPDGSAYFRTSAKADYGKLSKKPLDDLRSGARVEVNHEKESPLDFALWKTVPDSDPHAWTSDSQHGVGRGRPGWHLECSAMNQAILGDQIDIHAGGMDLIFPHHENEIAQSECWTGKPFSKYWLHNGFVNVSGEKMSKSLGNFSTIRNVLKRYDANTIRYFLFSHHYRSPVDFNDEALEGAKNRIQKLYRTLRTELDALGITLTTVNNWVSAIDTQASPEVPARVLGLPGASFQQLLLDRLSEDLNSPKAIVLLDDALNHIGALRHGWSEEKQPELLQWLQLACATLNQLGFVFEPVFPTVSLPTEALVTLASELNIQTTEQTGEAILQNLIEARKQAKSDKNWAQADAIRNQLTALGIKLIDHKDGTTVFEVDASAVPEKVTV